MTVAPWRLDGRVALVTGASSGLGARFAAVLASAGAAVVEGPLQDQPLAALTDVLDLNLVAAVDLCRLAAPLLFAQAGSTVVNVASIYGLVGSGFPGQCIRVRSRESTEWRWCGWGELVRLLLRPEGRTETMHIRVGLPRADEPAV